MPQTLNIAWKHSDLQQRSLGQIVRLEKEKLVQSCRQ
ncbi:hypothetical protein QTG54_002908 [Skeletonema marinoi]|uniref:Uncharacterized protein n=1 Tax=Skeletonema marinoi TaxID=267567 RepID=A0AAD8YGW1_9STRA|nr:hypothetical protein QTG54_002908 [Skeletonema marinoi]